MNARHSDASAPGGAAGEPGTALVTGAARRIGAAIARQLHALGHDVVIHYNGSAEQARALAAELDAQRAGSALTLQADLLDADARLALVRETLAWRGRLDVLVNNASSFYPTPVGEATEAHWDDLAGTNLRAPFFITQAAAPALRATHGAVVNMVDIHAERPIAEHPIYCAAKAGLVALTRALARDLAPEVRVNAIAPGAILWPEQGGGAAEQSRTLERVPLGRIGSPAEIARAVAFLVQPDSYVSGQILAVDGGRSVT